jgi:hypothetical protein
MTKLEALTKVMNETRNGTDGYTRCPFTRNFLYTSGIQEVADAAGAYWLLDIAGTEVAPLMLKRFKDTGNSIAFLRILSAKGAAKLQLINDEGAAPEWSKTIHMTDFPDGDWKLMLAVDQVVQPGKDSVVMCLISEN